MAGASPVQTQEDLVPPPPAAIGHRLGAVLLAPAAAVALHVVLAEPAGIDLQVRMGGTGPAQPLALRETLVVALGVALAAWLVVAVLQRLMGAERGRRTWLLVSLGALVASLLPVLAMDVPASSRWGLVALHGIVGLVVIPAMASSRPAVPLRRGNEPPVPSAAADAHEAELGQHGGDHGAAPEHGHAAAH
jgi:hypothetical protein